MHVALESCFWCHSDRGVVLGLEKMPRRVCADYHECDSCKEVWKQGIAIIEVQNSPLTQNQLPIDVRGEIKLYPTSRYVVVKSEAIPKLVETKELQDRILERGRALMEADAFCALFDNWTQEWSSSS